MRSLVLLTILLSSTAHAAGGHPVYSLTDNRVLAHVQRGGGVVALAGSPGMAKYVNFGRPNLSWTLGQKLDGHRVAVADMYARLVMPLSDEQAAAARALYVRLSSPKPRDLEVKLNGKLAGRVSIVAGWQTVKVPLAAGLARFGENDVQLVISHTASKKPDNPAVEWVQLGGDPPPDAAPVVYQDRALLLPSGGGLAYYVQVPAGGRLGGDATGCDVAVRARAQAGKPVDGTLRGAGAEVDLSPLAGKVVRLDLAAKGCDARLTGAALTAPGPAPAVHRDARPKNVLFWVMDSLRADRVKPFFPSARPEVPNWEKLAREATLFLNTYVQGNESRASHASLWTALYVGQHRMIGEKDVLADRFTTLGKAMKSSGLFTLGVSSNGYITKRWGFGDGWDVFKNHIHEGGGTRGEDVWSHARDLMKGHTEQPFFLYLGFVDTHVSWRAHEPWISRYDTGYEGRFVKIASDPDVDKIVSGKLKITDRDKQRIIALYDSDVSYQDDLIGKVRAELDKWGVAKDTMVVIVADHGDEQWEDGRLGHGGSLRETLIHVPLAIYYPPLFPPGAIDEGVETIDVLPTLLDALGQKPIPDAQGESLLPLAQGVGRGYPRPSISSMYEDAHAMLLGGWKILVRGNGEPHVFDMAADHLEKKDLAGSRPLERRFLTDALSTFLVYQKDWKKTRWGVASNLLPGFAEELDR